MDLLLDINVAVDICAKRPAYYQDADLALAKFRQEGGQLWLYAGSVQILEYVTRDAPKHTFKAAGQPITARQLHYHTRQVLKTFAEDKQWLAALAAEGAVFDSEDPEDEQLIRALDRFAPGTIKLLTRDQDLCDQYPEHTITPAAYLAQPAPPRRLDFIDLAAQQQQLRPQLERNLHRVLHHGQ